MSTHRDRLLAMAASPALQRLGRLGPAERQALALMLGAHLVRRPRGWCPLASSLPVCSPAGMDRLVRLGLVRLITSERRLAELTPEGREHAEEAAAQLAHAYAVAAEVGHAWLADRVALARRDMAALPAPRRRAVDRVPA